MIIDRESPANIYGSLSGEIESILNKLVGSTDDEQVSQAKIDARTRLEGFQEKIKRNISELERHAEWDTFTFAFYGETNAGKSTIIEALRIIFGERGKLEEQQKFRQHQEVHNLTKERFVALAQVILESTQSLTQIEKLRRDIADRNNTSPWRRFMCRFIKFNEVRRLDKKNYEIQRQKLLAEQELEHLQSEVERLKTWVDGAIIGNGSSDFTLETTEYIFECGDQIFKILDVPGIQGKEIKVQDNIWAAVRKAHAVFYITRKAAPPQKGDENSRGTLEKIRDHLGDQTEVWTIYNKPITNPRQLETFNQTSQDERESLNDLDNKMREQLGENYRGMIRLSAHPAFLAVAQCLIPRSMDADRQHKFLSEFQAQDLLSKSNFEHLQNMLTGDLLKDYKIKIRLSNFKKARMVVSAAVVEIANIQCHLFQPLGQELKQRAEDAGNELETAQAALMRRLESQVETAINDFITSGRRTIYKSIEEDISNSEFKSALENCIEDELEKLQKHLPTLMEKELTKFQEDACEVADKLKGFTDELMEIYGRGQENYVDGMFNLQINIDNGLNVRNLVVGLLGGALMLWNPAGWFVTVVSVATLLVSVGKALFSMLSTDYKKSQQRKSASENLGEITKSIRSSIREKQAGFLPELQSKVSGIKVLFERPALQVAEINDSLVEVVSKLTALESIIETVGAE